MKYIRTKDGIFRVLQWGSKRKDYVSVDVKHYGIKVYDTNEIISKAQTIEELCDEFVGIDNSNYYYQFTELEKVNGNYSYLNEEYRVFYGAIWTDKGLIYVAKMNDKGELELL